MADYYVKLNRLQTSGTDSVAAADGDEIDPPVGVGATTMLQCLADPVPGAPINFVDYLVIWST